MLSGCRRGECHTLSGLAFDDGLAILYNLFLFDTKKQKKEKKNTWRFLYLENLKMDFSSTLGPNLSFHHRRCRCRSKSLEVIKYDSIVHWACVCVSDVGQDEATNDSRHNAHVQNECDTWRAKANFCYIFWFDWWRINGGNGPNHHYSIPPRKHSIKLFTEI